jgi:hypothetical protein
MKATLESVILDECVKKGAFETFISEFDIEDTTFFVLLYCPMKTIQCIIIHTHTHSHTEALRVSGCSYT